MKRWFLIVVCLLSGAVLGTAITSSLLRGQGEALAHIPRDLTSYREVVKKVLPAVVSIEAKQANKPKASRRRAPMIDDQQLPEDLRRFFDQVPRAPEQEGGSSPLGFGSGFVVDPRGVILTNFHVVEGADQVEVQLRDGRKFQSKDIKSDPKTDLALVRIEVKEALPFLALGDSNTMEIGDRVLAVGAPFGLTGSVTAGIVSAKGRSLNVNLYEDFIQTDAAINPGNSGGPLVNMEGKVIGITSAIKSRSGGFQGVGLAISSNLVRNVMEQLQRDGVVHRGYLGVQVKDVENAELAAKLGLKEAQGVVVTQVFENTPAGKAGLVDGDVIVSLNGKPLKDGKELQTVVATLPLGKPVEVVVMRDGKSQTLQVTIEEQPQKFGNSQVPLPRGSDSEPSGVNLDKIGIEVADLNKSLAERFGFKETSKGVLITAVDRGSVGALAGLKRGQLITRVDQHSVTSAAKLKEILSAASLEQGVLLRVQSPQGGTSYVLLKAS